MVAGVQVNDPGHVSLPSSRASLDHMSHTFIMSMYCKKKLVYAAGTAIAYILDQTSECQTSKHEEPFIFNIIEWILAM